MLNNTWSATSGSAGSGGRPVTAPGPAARDKGKGPAASAAPYPPVAGSASRSRINGAVSATGLRPRSALSSAALAHAPTVDSPAARFSAGPAKKLVFKGFKVKPKLPDNFEHDTWESLRRAVVAIHDRQPVSDSLEELYKACENLCHHNKQAALYARLQALCKTHVEDELRSLTRSLGGMRSGVMSDSEAVAGGLRLLDECWRRYCQQMVLIRSIFLYLDRTYVLQTPSTKSLWNMSMDLFREHILEDPQIQRRVVDGIIYEIDRERRGEQVSRPLLRSLLRMMVDLSVYIRVFEGPFLQNTRAFYNQLSRSLILDIDVSPMATGDSDAVSHPGAIGVSNYLAQVSERLAQENSRCVAGEGYLDPLTRKKLIQVLEDELIRTHAQTLLDFGLDALIEGQRIDDLARLYGLLERVGMLGELKRRVSEFIKSKGVLLVKDPARDKSMVADLLKFKSKLDELLKQAFRGAESFDHAIKEAFENFINQRQNKPAEMIAKYIDELLKRVKGSEVEINQQLDQCLVIFRFIHGKDVFEAFYSKDLAKRLLLKKSASDDAEKDMLMRLKTECGPGFTLKLEGMFADVETSKEFQKSFDAAAGFKERLGSMEMSVQVLTLGFWPTYPTVHLNLPTEFINCQAVFAEFYKTKHSGRNLAWQNSLGSSVIKAHFQKGLKELHVSLFQTVVLLVFNNHAQLSFTDLLNHTGLEAGELTRTLQSLACGKARVLTKTPKSKDVAATDMFEVNDAFENSYYRVKINTIQMKETAAEQEETNERVFQDRIFQVDAAIVRIMKTEKRCTHAVLVTKLFSLLKFPIPTEDLKKRIESLIERDYLERDDGDKNTYVYVA
ncbi:Cullin family-domain-containing protein [Entophlyctis helioformis]|nr:Cullin family-domain-containing protein [Entophlyctis helioformis]